MEKNTASYFPCVAIDPIFSQFPVYPVGAYAALARSPSPQTPVTPRTPATPHWPRQGSAISVPCDVVCRRGRDCRLKCEYLHPEGVWAQSFPHANVVVMFV